MAFFSKWTSSCSKSFQLFIKIRPWNMNIRREKVMNQGFFYLNVISLYTIYLLIWIIIQQIVLIPLSNFNKLLLSFFLLKIIKYWFELFTKFFFYHKFYSSIIFHQIKNIFQSIHRFKNNKYKILRKND